MLVTNIFLAAIVIMIALAIYNQTSMFRLFNAQMDRINAQMECIKAQEKLNGAYLKYIVGLMEREDAKDAEKDYIEKFVAPKETNER